MTTPMPDLYAIHGIDRSADSDEIGRVIAGRDLELEQQLIPDTDPRRRQLHTAFAVLADPARRATYDDALRASLRMTWEDLEHLGNFGTFPDVDLQPQPAPQHPQHPQAPPANAYNYPTYSPQAPQPGPLSNVFGPVPGYAAQVPAQPVYGQMPTPYVDRPSASTRLGMMLLDGLVFGSVSSLLWITVDAGNVLSGFLFSLVSVAWFLGFEVMTGASPVKHLFGYEVRNAQTGEKLSWQESAKRQWWRVIHLVPGIGQLISFIGMIAIGSSIKPETGLIGSNDRWAGAEVVRKNGR